VRLPSTHYLESLFGILIQADVGPPWRFAGRAGRNQNTGMCAAPCYQEVALASRKPRNEGESVVVPVPRDKFPPVRKPVKIQRDQSRNPRDDPAVPPSVPFAEHSRNVLIFKLSHFASHCAFLAISNGKYRMLRAGSPFLNIEFRNRLPPPLV
jgi:hypothetical protein